MVKLNKMSAVLALCALGFAGSVNAAPTEYVKAHQRAALAGRLQQGPGLVLERVPGPTAFAVEARFMATLAGRPTSTFLMPPAAVRQVRGDRLVYSGPTGSLEFALDGSGLRYTRTNVAPDASIRELTVEQMDDLGRRVIADRLAGIVELADDERLVLVDVQPRVLETFDVRTQKAARYVESTRATFAVEKQGLLILSNTVDVDLRRSDEIVGVRVALERFKISGERLALAEPKVLRDRVRFGALDVDAPARGEHLKSFLCGYMSPRGVAGSRLEPVCLVQYAETNAAGAQLGRAEFIPMVAAPRLDPAVPMTRYLREHGEPESRDAYRAAMKVYAAAK